MLFMICALFFAASLSFGIYYTIKGIIHKDKSDIKIGLLYFVISLGCVALPFMCVVSFFVDGYNN